MKFASLITKDPKSDMWDLDVTLSLTCPVCGFTKAYPTSELDSFWRWGLEGTIEDSLRKLKSMEWLCDSCGVTSRLDKLSFDTLGDIIRADVSDLAIFEGSELALEQLARALAVHLLYGNCTDYSYVKGGVVYPEERRWLLGICPCPRCDAARKHEPYFDHIVLHGMGEVFG